MPSFLSPLLPWKTTRPTAPQTCYLTSTQADASGYFPARAGQFLDKMQRYEVVRLLDLQPHYSTFLIRDCEFFGTPVSCILTAKVFTAWATSEYRDGRLPEPSIIRDVLKGPEDSNLEDTEGDCLPQYTTDFEIRGPHGHHLCFIMSACSLSMEQVMQQIPKGLSQRDRLRYLGHPRSIPNASNTATLDLLPGNNFEALQHITYRLIVALDILHARGIIHGEVQPRNILYPYDAQLGEPTNTLAESEEIRLGESLYPVLHPQPLPYDKRNFSVILGNLGSALRENATGYLGMEVGPYTAPEIILLTGCGGKVDVWALGCVVFELITGEVLFDLKPVPATGATSADHLLDMMVAVTKEEFQHDISDRIRNRYFTPDEGRGRHEVRTKGFVRDDIPWDAETFIRTCLRLDPNKRPTTQELLDPEHAPMFIRSLCKQRAERIALRQARRSG